MEIQSETIQVSENCVQRDRGVNDLESDFPVMDIPVIDLGLLEASSNSCDEFEKIREALGSWGCFQV